MTYFDDEILNEHGYILKNKLGITDKEELLKKEEEISKKKMIEMFVSNTYSAQDVLNFEVLKEIHKTLFSDIYDFAGQIRTCDISKDNFHFAHFRFLEPSADYAIKEFKEDKSIDSCIDLYASMNVLHPFMEGNGRATRFWFDLVLQQEFNKLVNWSNIPPSEYMDAMKKSHFKTKQLKKLIINNLIDADKIDEYTFFRGIDNSYSYEGMNSYNAIELYENIKDNGDIYNKLVNNEIEVIKDNPTILKDKVNNEILDLENLDFDNEYEKDDYDM